jgi:Zn finger protein HypA/HybF involved in hydrogenase expression
MNNVVKCSKCDLYFTRTEIDKNCPFCHAGYNETEEIIDNKIEDTVIKEKKVITKNRKDSFKVWKI